MISLSFEDKHPFDPIKEFVYYYGSQKEYLTKERDSKGWLKTVTSFTDFINDYVARPSHPETLIQIKPLRAHYKKRMALICGKKIVPRDYYFVTICPPDHITLNTITSMIKRIAKWSCWSEFIGVIEQRSSHEKDIYGVHIHFLALKTKDYAHSNVKDRLNNYKKKYNCNIQLIDETLAPEKQEYFFDKYGENKAGIKKSKIMIVDQIFRTKEGIPRYYGEKMKFTVC